MMELAGAPDLPIALADCSASRIHGLDGPSTSRPYAILSTIATENRRTEVTQSSGASIIPLQHMSACFRCMAVYRPTLDLVKGGCKILRCRWYFGPQRSQVRVGDHPIL